MQRIRKVITLIGILMTAFVLTACLPPNYTREEAKAVREKGKTMVTEYLQKNYNTKPSGSIEIVEGMCENPDLQSVNNTQGRYLSMLVKSKFEVNKEQYTIYLNTENGNAYTDFLRKEINEATAEIMRDTFDGEGVLCKLAADNVDIPLEIATGDENEVIATIRNVYPDTVTASTVKAYVENSLLESGTDIGFDLYCSGNNEFFGVDDWKDIMAEYPSLARINLCNYPEKYVTQAISMGELPIAANMWIAEQYRIRRTYYALYTHEIVNKNDVYVNAVTRIFEVTISENGDEERTTSDYECHLQVTGDHIEIKADNREAHRLFFKGDQYKKKKAEAKYSFSDKAEKYKFFNCEDDYYTFDTGLEKKIFFFLDEFTVDIK